MSLSKCIFIFFILTALKSCLAADPNSCAFNFTTDFPTRAPLILNNDSKDLVIPENDEYFVGVILKKGDNILLACAGADNNFNDANINSNGVPSAVAQCTGNDILLVNNKNYGFRDLECKNRTHAMIVPVGSSCAGGKAKLYEIGFNVTTAPAVSFWFPLITTCFDPSKSVTYYSSHSIYGKGLLAEQDGNRPNFNIGLKDELYPDFSPSRVYSHVEQLATFTKILSEDMALDVLDKGEYLDRGHLAPDGDFFYKVTADATYFYINVAPQWHVINGYTWSQLEMKVRDLAKHTLLNYEIHTGTHGILKLEDGISYKEHELYLYYELILLALELPVPQFYWKIVVNPVDKTGIAFISVNDHLFPETAELPCESICGAAEWDVSDIICCTIDDLKNAYQDDIPNIDIHQTLHGLGSSSNLGCISLTTFILLLYLQYKLR